MKEIPILFSTEMVKAILDGRKSQTRRVVTKHNSFIGEGGDWNKLDFDGKEVLSERLQPLFSDCPKGSMGKAITDNGFRCKAWIDKGYEHFQYLHVGYDWHEEGVIYRVYPRYNPNELLWVRETWATEKQFDKMNAKQIEETGVATVPLWYKNDLQIDRERQIKGRWRSGRFMPKWATRIWLEITDIKVERIQDITEDDVLAEGVHQYTFARGVLSDNNEPRWKFIELWDSINEKRGYGWDKNCWVWCISFKRVDR